MTDQQTDHTPQCEYAATADDAGVRGVDGEVVDGDSVYCTADADVVLRPPGMNSFRFMNTDKRVKRVFCRGHAQYLRREKTEDEVRQMNTPPKQWEQCGENPEKVNVDAP